MTEQPTEYKFGCFSRHKYQDLVFYVVNEDGQTNTGLFEMPDTPENRALMEALIPHPVSTPPRGATPAKKPGCYATCPFDDLCANDLEKIREIEQMTAQDERKKVLDELKQEIKYLTNLYGLCDFWSRPTVEEIHNAIKRIGRRKIRQSMQKKEVPE